MCLLLIYKYINIKLSSLIITEKSVEFIGKKYPDFFHFHIEKLCMSIFLIFLNYYENYELVKITMKILKFSNIIPKNENFIKHKLN